MSLRVFFVAIACTALFAAKPTRAQQPSPVPAPVGDVESLKQQMLEMQAGLKQMQIQHQREVAALRAQVESLHKVIGDLQRTVATGAGQPVPPVAGKTAVAAQKPAAAGDGSFPTTDESVAAPTGQPGASGSGIAAASSGFPTSDAAVAAAPGATTPGWLRGADHPRRRGQDVSQPLVRRTVLGRDLEREASRSTRGRRPRPQQRGFNARNTELALDGAVDPYFEGFANIVFKLDNDNETSVEVEEAFMQTTTLPWSLQAKGGQFFAPFGRINPQHPHVWDFVDAPVVVGRLLGPDGLRGVGAQLAWLMPLPWYSQLSLAVQNGNGGTWLLVS